jgi:hypothetical protein
LEDCTSFVATVITLELQPRLVDPANVTDCFHTFELCKIRLGSVQATPAMSFQTIVSRKQFLEGVVVWTQNARLVARDPNLDPHSLDLGLGLLVVGITFPLVASRFRLALIASRRRWEVCRSIVVVVLFFLLLRFFVILWSLLSAESPLDIFNVDPHTVSLTVAFLGHSSVIKPGFGRKIDGFGTVIAKVVARMITVRECNDKFPFVMY